MILKAIRQIFLLQLLLLFTFGTVGQKNSAFFHISGQVRVDKGDPAGTIVSLVNLTNKTTDYNVTLTASGKFDFDLTYFTEYKLSVAKDSHYPKEIEISTMVPEAVWKKDSIFPPLPVVVTIYRKIADATMSFEGKTIGKICYSPNGKLDNFDSDVYINDKDIKREIDNYLKTHEDELFNKKLADAIEFEKKNQIGDAIRCYQEALQFRKNDQFLKSKLKELTSDLLGMDQEARIEAEYNRLIAAGDQNVTGQKYPEAIDNFKGALVIKSGDKVATDKLANAEQLLAASLADKAKQEAEYNRLISSGDQNVAGQKYPEAIDNFRGALAIKAGDKIATSKLADAEKLQAKFLADRAKQEAEYNRLVAAGDQNVTGQKYPEAIDNFKGALVIKSGDKVATDKLANAEQLLAASLADKAKQEAEYNRLISSGDQNVAGQKYPEAIDNFRGALAIKSGDKIATSKLADAEKLQAKFLADRAKQEAEYNRLVAAGDQNVTGQKFPEAIDNFKGALVIKSGDKVATDKLANAEQLLAASLADKAKQEAEYNRLISSGDQNVAGQKYPEAIDNFRGALAIKSGDKIATSKLADAEKLQAKFLADRAKQEAEYNRLVAAGDQNVTGQKYPEAIDNFKGALVIKSGDKVATDKLANAEQLLAASLADKAKQEAEYNRLISSGDQNVAGQKYPEAIDNFKGALAIKAGDKIATSKLADAEKLQAKFLADRAKQEAEYNRLIAVGDQNVTGQKYPEAIDNFKGALVIKSGDKVATDKLANAEQLLAASLADQAKQEAEYNRLISSGDQNVAGQKYPEAIDNFRGALSIKSGDKIATSKLADAEKLQAKFLADRAKQEAEYNRLIAVGDQNVTGQKYPEAIDNFKGALVIKSGDKVATDKLANAEQLLAASLADLAKQEAEYNRLISTGDQNVAGQKYPEAIDNFRSALAIKSGDKIATSKLADAEKLQAKFLADRAKQEAEYNRLVAAGDQNVTGKKYPEAIDNFKGALVIKTGDKVATDKLANAEQLLAASLADKAKQETEYNRLISSGDQNVAGQKYPEAIDNFKGALAIKAGDKIATSKLADAEKLQAKFLADRAKQEAEYNRLIAVGDQNVTGQKYPEAIDNFKGALVIKSGDKVATDKLANAEQLLAASLADQAKQEAEYNRLISSGDQNVAGQKYPEAIDNFKGALAIKSGDKIATSKLADAEKLQAKFLADRAKQEAEYNRLIAAGDQNVTGQKYPEAIDNFKGALVIKSGDKVATDKLANAEQLLAKQLADKAKLEEEYKRLIAAGDANVTAVKYQEAIDNFKGALKIKTGDPVATSKLAETEKLLKLLIAENQRKEAEQRLLAEKQKKYNDYISRADQLFNTKVYPDAKKQYQEAIRINDIEKYPKDRIIEIDSIMARLEAERLLAQKKVEEQVKLQGEGNYLKNIETGDANYKKSLWTAAIFYYQEALKFKAADKYALERIDVCKKMIDSNITADKMREYASYVQRANDDLQAKKYSSARFYYQKANEILPWENYPLEQLKVVEKVIATSGVSGTDAQFFDAIKKADDAMAQKNFAVARFYYQMASSIKPDEEYPKQQLKRISTE